MNSFDELNDISENVPVLRTSTPCHIISTLTTEESTITLTRSLSNASNASNAENSEIQSEISTESDPLVNKESQLASLPRRPMDYYGVSLATSPVPQERIVYEVVSRAHHYPTRALFIGNLRKPIDALQFQNHLRVLVKRVHASYKVDRAWMNRSRTHAIVLTNSLEAARAIRGQLNGKVYPSADERDQLMNSNGISAVTSSIPIKSKAPQYELFVDYLRLSQIGEWIFEEDYGPKDAVWRVDYRRQDQYGDIAAEHTLLEGEFRPLYYEVDRRKPAKSYCWYSFEPYRPAHKPSLSKRPVSEVESNIGSPSGKRSQLYNRSSPR